MGDVLEKTKSSKLKENSTSVDWRGRACSSNYHGGMAAAAFVLGLFLCVLSLKLSFFVLFFVFCVVKN